MTQNFCFETAFQTEGGMQCCITGQYEKPDVCLSIRACKPILEVTQNNNMNLKISIVCLL